ncbi:MAG: hypothetical protein BWY74_00073 [Firmicutes bacterium ADurb.Bin419]|nr:MAG: hypothetical protein BWY74_00073 [Firmicutes bacterium ADurb.Bin419]
MSEKIIFAYQHSKDSQPVPILKRECPNYRVYRLTPDRLVPDGKVVEEILMTIAAVMDNPLKLQDRCIVYNPFQPVFYEILYSKGKIYFNYVLPEMYQDVIVNKIKTIYKASSLVEIQDYYNCFNNKYYCSFIQKNHYLFSLNVDYRENGIIEGFLSMLNNLQANDQVLFQIGIIPLNDNWKIQWKRAYEKYKDGESLNIHSSIPVMVMDKVFGFTEGLLSVMDMILGEKHEQHKKEENIRDISNFESGRYSRMTRQKVNYSGYQVQMKLFSSNNDTCYYYSKIMDGIFKVLDAEQEITINKIKINRDTERKFDFQVNKNIFSTKELSCFLQMPNRRMQTEYKAKMDSIGTVETKIPKQLLNGSIPIGETSYKGEKIMTYWNTKDKDIAPMHRVITGLQRTGKSSYIKNFAIDAIRAGHSCFVIDTIKDLSVANDIRDYMPQKYQDKIIVLDFGDIEHLLPLAWNEFKLHESDPRKKLMLASIELSGILFVL